MTLSDDLEKIVLQDTEDYGTTRESLALLKILALSSADVQCGKVKPIEQAFGDIEKRIAIRACL